MPDIAKHADESETASTGPSGTSDSSLPVPTLESVLNSANAKMLMALEASHSTVPLNHACRDQHADIDLRDMRSFW